MTVTDETLISRQIEKAGAAAQKLQQWLDVAGQWQAALARQQKLQDQLAQAQQKLAALEAMYQTAPSPAPAVSLDTALTGLENCPALGALFAGEAAGPDVALSMATGPDEAAGPDAALSMATTPDEAAGPDAALSMATGPAEAAAGLAKLFALPAEPKAKDPEPAEDDLQLEALLNTDEPWMKNLDDLSRTDDPDTTAEDLDLLFKDIEESPDSPWADPWDTVFETTPAGITAGDLLPAPEWDETGGLQTAAPAAAPIKKKRGLLSKFFR